MCEESNVFIESIEKSMCNFFKVGVLRQVQGYIRGVVGYNSMIVGGYSSAVGLKETETGVNVEGVIVVKREPRY